MADWEKSKEPAFEERLASLLVAAESTLLIFDAQNPANPAVQLIEMGQQITSISADPVGTRAYLTVAGSTDVEPVGLNGTIPQRLAGPIVLPEIQFIWEASWS